MPLVAQRYDSFRTVCRRRRLHRLQSTSSSGGGARALIGVTKCVTIEPNDRLLVAVGSVARPDTYISYLYIIIYIYVHVCACVCIWTPRPGKRTDEEWMKNNDVHDWRGGYTSIFIPLNIFFLYTCHSLVRQKTINEIYVGPRIYGRAFGFARGPQRFRNDRHSVAIIGRGDFVFASYIL